MATTLTEATNDKAFSRDMKIGLFIPCYIDMIYPEVGIATLEILERFGLNVGFPLNQTCCGQPMSNSGDEANAAARSASLSRTSGVMTGSLARQEAASNKSGATSTRWNRRMTLSTCDNTHTN